MGQTRGPVFVLALVGALALGTGIAYWLDRMERRDSRAESPTEEDAQAAATRRTASAARGSHRDERRSPQALVTEEARSAATEPATGKLTGRVLDASGQPLAGARIVLSLAEARGFEVLDPGAALASLPVAEGLSGQDGRFHLTLQRGVPVDVQVMLLGYVDEVRADAYAGQELELVLTPGVRLFGTLTRARDGVPVPGARVRAFRLGGPASLERETTSRADGSYELFLPFREDARLEVVPEELLATDWLELELGPGDAGRKDDACRKDVVLQDGMLLTGRVTAADTGRALPDAVVGEGWWFRRAVTCDARGEYQLRGFGAPGVREVAARASGHATAHKTAAQADPEGVVRLDFALEPARAVHGRVVDENGAPLAGAYVAAVASEFDQAGQHTDWVSTHTDEQGCYRLGELSRALGHALLITRRGYGTQVHDFPESEFDAPELELADIVLRRPALLAGRVEDPHGAALADVELELSGWNHDRYRFTRTPTARARGYVDRRSVRSDSVGRFWFGDLSAGRYRLVTRVVGRPESAPLELELVTGEQREDVVLRLDAGGVVHGHVQDEGGRPLAGVYVSAQGELLRDPAARPAGHVHVRTGADGRFELAGLPEGEYTIRAYPLDGASPGAGEPWLPATVEHVATGAPPIRIELRRGASIRGRVLDARGAPLFGYVVAAVAKERAEEYSQTDGEGRFSLSVPRDSRWTLEVRGAPLHADFHRVFLRREGVPAGSQDLELRLDP